MNFNIYFLAWFFLIYSFLGWCSEVIFVALDTHQFDNRGFLRGPVCPIYGVGITGIVSCLMPLAHTWIPLFIVSVLLTTLLELGAGVALKKIFHHEWWNYDEFRFNFHGYICLRFSLLWGVGCLFVVKALHPLVNYIVSHTPRTIGLPLLILFGVTFIADLIVTVLSIRSYSKRLRALDEIESRLHQISDELAFDLFDGVSTVMSLIDKKNWSPETAEEARQLVKKREPLLKRPNHVHRRLLNAFHFLYEKKYKQALEYLKRYWLHIKK